MNPIADLLSDLRTKLPAASKVITEGAGTEVSQASLTGPLDAIKAAVSATPNSSNMFPSRESYLQFGYAIKAALPDNEPAAFDLFSEWCARWSDGENDPDVVAADWRRMKPPYRRGASWLYELAETYGSFDRATVWHEPVPATIELNPFRESEEKEAAEAHAEATRLFNVLSIDEIFNRPDPTFLIDRHIPDKSVGFLYGDPGTGKSFIALDWALHLAYERPNWHGDAIVKPSDVTVIYLAGEGAAGFKTRVKAWLSRHNIPASEAARFGLVPQSVNFMSPEDVKRLAATLRHRFAGKVVLVVVDTVSRAMPGADENLQKEMTLFVQACDTLRDEFGCVVLGVHHAGKKGDMRGSTVLLGAGDFVFKLDRKKGASVGHLLCEKQKDAPDGWSEPYRFDVVEVENGKSSLVPTRCAISIGPSQELTADLAKRILKNMDAAWQSGEPWGKTYHAGERQASRVLAREWGFEAERAEEILKLWEQSGVIVEEIVSKKSKRKGLRVAAEGYTDEAEEGETSGVFE